MTVKFYFPLKFKLYKRRGGSASSQHSYSTIFRRYKTDERELLLQSEMEKVKRHKTAIIAVLFVMLLVFIFAEVYLQEQSAAQNLYPTQIREYQGENLSSIVDVREYTIDEIPHINQSTYRLTVTGLVNRTLDLTYDEVVKGFQNYQKVITLHCVEGWSAKILWEGVLVRDLIMEAGNTSAAKVVIFTAADGFTTSLPLNYFFDNDILLAYKMNGLVIPPERGFPFQLVAESKYGYKWIKWLTNIELSDDVNYRGFWESRGFSNNATVP
jgi:DMSO/TMAO reductase YedYZ molybdopterin-dependent catalytic subunit